MRLNSLLETAQINFNQHISAAEQIHQKETPFIRISCEYKKKHTGRYSVCYCSVCNFELASELSHENVEVTVDEEKYTLNKLDVWLIVGANELSVKRRPINKLQCILRLPLTGGETFSK